MQLIFLILLMLVNSNLNYVAFQNPVDEKSSDVVVICAAESQDILDAFSGRGMIAGAWPPENLDGNCFQEIVDQLATNLQSKGKSLSVVQRPFDPEWEIPENATLMLYTTMSAHGGPIVIIMPLATGKGVDETALVASHMQDEYSIYVLSNNQKIGVANFATGIILYDLEDCEAASTYFEMAADEEFSWYTYTESGEDKRPNIAVRFYQATCAILDENFERAVDILTTAFPATYSEGETENTRLIQTNLQGNLAYAYLQLDQAEKAFTLMNQVVEAAKTFTYKQFSIDALFKRAELYSLVSNYDDAIDDLSAAIELAPQDPELYILRGQMYLNLYEWDKSLEDFNAAIELAPRYADAYFQRGVLYYSILQTGQELREEALADFQHYLELAPDGEHAEQAREYAAQIEAELAALTE